MEKSQLPLERMMPQTVVYINNKDVCVFCQYFLHYVQQAITNPTTEVLHNNITYRKYTECTYSSLFEKCSLGVVQFGFFVIDF